MSWALSRFRAGDVVEVRSKAEILGTLDDRGCVDGLPFMPEMLEFCGQRVRVSAVAHKTCDFVHKTWGRRLQRTVHLAGTRCDGSAHGGCEADCNLFWKDAWLKPAGSSVVELPTGAGCSEAALVASTRAVPIDKGSSVTNTERYSCQATKLYEASEPLPYWDLRQYVYDVTTRNHGVRQVLQILVLAALRALARNTPFGWRYVNALSEWAHVRLTGRGVPRLSSKIGAGEQTPAGRLNLKVGELVRIKTQKEIESTVDEHGKNRGLSFDHEEMGLYCGQIVRVRRCVTTIIDEIHGNMRRMKEPCIILDGVVCKSRYASCRLNCPREIPSYWREIWLERVADER
jgi:hypothetical protein